MFTKKYLPVDVNTYFISALQNGPKLIKEENKSLKTFLKL
jgi:hypothetical protein